MDDREKKISFNKYLLFYLLAIVVLSFTVFPKIGCCIRYDRATGTVKYFEPVRVFTISGWETKQQPRVDFIVNNKAYFFFGNTYLRDAYRAGDTVKVIYDPASPHKGYVNTVLGIFAPDLANVFPFLFITFLCFGLEYIPDRIVVRF
jgi:hypothetical protein